MRKDMKDSRRRSRNRRVIAPIIALALCSIMLIPASAFAGEQEQGVAKPTFIRSKTLTVYLQVDGVTVSDPDDFDGRWKAQWWFFGWRDATGWKKSGESTTIWPIVLYRVVYSDVTALDTPANSSAFLGWQNRTEYGNYIIIKGTLAVNIIKNGATASFNIEGPKYFTNIYGRDTNYGPTQVPIGNYTVTFTQPFGYDLAITASTFTVSVPTASGELLEDATETVTGTYTRQYGTLNVNITDPGAGGTFWIIGPSDFTPVLDQTTNYSASVPVGQYIVIFFETTGWNVVVTADTFGYFTITNVAAGAVGTLYKDATETVNGVYSREMGTLTVFIQPDEVNGDGTSPPTTETGQWRLKDSPEWHSSGESLLLPSNTYTIQFSNVVGWTKPLSNNAAVVDKITTEVIGIYSQHEGGLQVFIEDKKAREDGALWRPKNHDQWYESGYILRHVPTGEHALEFMLTPGFVLPDLTSAKVKANTVNKYTGEYVRPLIVHMSDYNGDGLDDHAVFDEKTGKWAVATTAKGASPTAVKIVLERKFGGRNDIPAPGDYDGDGVADLCYYRESIGKWRIEGQFSLNKFGQKRDIPVPGDFDGDGITDPALYRPTTGQWLIYDQFNNLMPTSTKKMVRVDFGGPEFVPTPGDFDGDGRTDLGIHNVLTGKWQVAIYDENREQWITKKRFAVLYGDIGDIPIHADYDGKGGADIAVYKRSGSEWKVMNQFDLEFGNRGDIPVPSDWAGLGRVIPAIFRTQTGQWLAVDNLLRLKHGAGGQPLMSGR